jgi:hypothetical protein
MNIAEEKLSLFHEIDELSEESLIELRKIIFKLKAKQKMKEKSSLENDISAVFGVLKATKGVSLEQMEAGIAKGACGD